MLCEEVGFRWWLAGMLANTGAALRELGRLDEARDRVREALAISQAMRDRRGVLYELRLLAGIAADAGEPWLAGALTGAADAESERAPVAHWIHDWSIETRPPPDSDESELARGLEEGHALELDAAVALALGDA
jgi:hypothetical protein